MIEAIEQTFAEITFTTDRHEGTARLVFHLGRYSDDPGKVARLEHELIVLAEKLYPGYARTGRPTGFQFTLLLPNGDEDEVKRFVQAVIERGAKKA